MRKPNAAVAFYALSIVLFPFALLGYAIWVGKLLAARPSGVSTSAQAPLSARWAMHNFGVREDQAANRLLPLLPGVPWLGMRLAFWPTVFAHRVTGFVPKTFRYPFEGDIPPQAEASARVTFFDKAVERALPGIDQLVILGAGFDTRPYRLPRDTRVNSFEVDAPKTQAVKRDILDKAGIDVRKVAFVPADFEKDDWLAELVDAGFDLGRPALFLWEGVTMYLDREAIEDTLRKVASCAKGSMLAFDYFTTETLESSTPYWRFGRAAAKAAGEPLKFGVDRTPPSRERLTELLRSGGLALLEQRGLGRETKKKRAWGGFAIAVVE
ncbi:class I SAM-dependent methyltransferase [Arthrobacter sp. B2a2-09]|uniref:class I SAM-dependent methyltransferase n=1 Tax=Arthrobacter sp. B2a2-09 TaxID=2952822 RepID=UPI0022CD65B1|nr:SAM-dependent methyltransferase [Arthrobacter sp. B2a2-09]MCZ9883837.1 SAM-dependent methyltransferase [Arthrobacter sp. B2a2-09]